MMEKVLPLVENWFQIYQEPLWYLALALSLFLWGRAILEEWHQFGRPLLSPIGKLTKILAISLISSCFLSYFFLLFDFRITKDEVFWIWLVLLIFVAFRTRFADISYCVGIIGILHLVAKEWLPLATEELGKYAVILQIFTRFHLSDWLWIVVGIQFWKFIAIRLDGAHFQKLLIDTIGSEQAVNGFSLRSLWPLGLAVPIGANWLWIPLVASYSTYNLSKPFKQNLRFTSTIQFGYALFFLLIVWLSLWIELFLWMSTVFAIIGPEGLYQGRKFYERRKRPLFISDERGLKVIAVIPQSPADMLGIKAGDIIQRVNGEAVQTEQDLRIAVAKSPICKLEVLDEYLDSHLLQKVLDEQDGKNLGIVGAVPFRNIPKKKEQPTNQATFST